MKLKSKIKEFLQFAAYNNPLYLNFWGDAVKFWKFKTFNIDIVNLGSNSGKYAFDYNGLPIKAANFAIGPQSLLHDYNIIKNYFSFLKDGAYVAVVLTPFSLLNSNYSKSDNLKYYTFLHPATVIDFNEEEANKAFELKYNPYLFAPKTFAISVYNLFRKNLKSFAKCDFHSNALYFGKMWKAQFGIENLEGEISDKHIAQINKKIELLREMISFLKERNLKPVLVIPPFHKELSKIISPLVLNNYLYQFIDKINMEGIKFFDYTQSNDFLADDIFKNSFMLNKKGAKLFTKKFLCDLGLLKD